MRNLVFAAVSAVVALGVFAAVHQTGNEYLYLAGYTILQFIVLATGWNVLGGYVGYVNFGAAAFFAIGAYTTVVVQKFVPAPVPILILCAGVTAGAVGLGMGYLTLRLRGAFFAIGTLALAVVLQTVVVNWDFVGGSRGVYVLRPPTIDIGPLTLPYMGYLFLLMLILAVVVVTFARMIERAKLGFGFATIRDDEAAAEACGVPTMKLKLIATALSGAFMGMAGAPLPYAMNYLQPSSTFGLDYAINAIAMPLVGGTGSWVGPVIGAILLGTLQQAATVTISSVANLLIVGAILTGFVVLAPNGILGLLQNFKLRAKPGKKARVAQGRLTP